MRNIRTAIHDKAPKNNANWQIVKNSLFLKLLPMQKLSKNLCQNKRYATAKPIPYVTSAIVIPRTFCSSCTCSRSCCSCIPTRSFGNTASPS